MIAHKVVLIVTVTQSVEHASMGFLRIKIKFVYRMVVMQIAKHAVILSPNAYLALNHYF